MFGSEVLDVVIGLVFIYLLYSLLATIIQEIIASYFSFRGKVLESAIFRMLEDDEKFDKMWKSIWSLFKKSPEKEISVSASEQFYHHPLIKYLSQGGRKSKAAYINKETFSKVIIDLLRGQDVVPGTDFKPLIQEALDSKKLNWDRNNIIDIDPQTLSYLKSIWADSQGDIIKFKEMLENWFDETMERATGWYKKYTQIILLTIGFVIAIIVNVDTIKIVEKLEKDPIIRAQMVQQADAFVKANPNLDKVIAEEKLKNDKLANELKKINQSNIIKTDSLKTVMINQIKVDSINLAIYDAIKKNRDTLIAKADRLVTTDLEKANNLLGLGYKNYKLEGSCPFGKIGHFLLSVLGWLITALAISMGAPFWFDLLNKLMKLRSSVANAKK